MASRLHSWLLRSDCEVDAVKQALLMAMLTGLWFFVLPAPARARTWLKRVVSGG